MLQAVVLIAAPFLFAVGAMSDVVSYKIPNWISLALAGLFVVAAILAGMAWSTAGWHAAVGFGALVFGIALFAFNLIGGGDAKLFAAAALWMGPQHILAYCMAFAIAGGVLSLVLVLARWRLAPALPQISERAPFLGRLLAPKAGLPYGLALGIGAMIVLPSTPLFQLALK